MEDSNSERRVDLRQELPRLLATLSAEDAAAVEEALIAAALRDSAPSPASERPVERRLGRGGEQIAVRWQDVDLIEAAILIAGAALTAKTIIVPLAALVVVLWKYRRRQVALTADEAQLVLLLKKAPAAGWSVEELLSQLPQGLELSKEELESRLDSFKTMRDTSGREIPLVTVKGGKWRVLDV